MSLSAKSLRDVMKTGGTFKFKRNNIRDDSETVIKGQWDNITHDLYRMAKTTILGNTITMTGVKDDDIAANTVNVIYEDKCATMGSVVKPGLIHSDSFSGCVFHLYREPLGHIIGVHANRSSGKLADPGSWMARRGGTKIFTWDSLNKITPSYFGAVFAFVQKTTIDFYAVEHKDGLINRVIHQETINCQ